MTVIATASNPRFSVSRVDIDRAGPTYTIDTLRDLRARVAATTPSCTSSPAPTRSPRSSTWRDADELFDLAHFVGVTRPGTTLYRRRAARGSGEPGRGAGAGDLVDRRARTGRDPPPGLVPGARRCRAVHRQTRPLPAAAWQHRRRARRAGRRPPTGSGAHRPSLAKPATKRPTPRSPTTEPGTRTSTAPAAPASQRPSSRSGPAQPRGDGARAAQNGSQRWGVVAAVVAACWSWCSRRLGRLGRDPTEPRTDLRRGSHRADMTMTLAEPTSSDLRCR